MREAYHNPNCDGAGPCSFGQVRTLPTSADPLGGNVILCRACLAFENNWRRERNKTLEPRNQFPLLPFSALNVYGEGEA